MIFLDERAPFDRVGRIISLTRHGTEWSIQQCAVCEEICRVGFTCKFSMKVLDKGLHIHMFCCTLLGLRKMNSSWISICEFRMTVLLSAGPAQDRIWKPLHYLHTFQTCVQLYETTYNDCELFSFPSTGWWWLGHTYLDQSPGDPWDRIHGLCLNWLNIESIYSQIRVNWPTKRIIRLFLVSH